MDMVLSDLYPFIVWIISHWVPSNSSWTLFFFFSSELLPTGTVIAPSFQEANSAEKAMSMKWLWECCPSSCPKFSWITVVVAVVGLTSFGLDCFLIFVYQLWWFVVCKLTWWSRLRLVLLKLRYQCLLSTTSQIEDLMTDTPNLL